MMRAFAVRLAVLGVVAAALPALQGCGGGSPLPATVTYLITDLGTLGGTESYALGLNENGQVVGWSYLTGDTTKHAFLWDGTIHDLGTLGGAESEACAINNAGHVAGTSDVITPGVDNQLEHAFLHDGTMHDLGTLPTHVSSHATDINVHGHVVGCSGFAAPFLYDGTTMQLLTPDPDLPVPEGINEADQVVGWLRGGQTLAFLYDGATVHDLGTLGGGNSQAFDINNNGYIVGHSYTAAGEEHAFLYSMAMYDLGTLGGVGSAAWAINDTGHMVGISNTVGQCANHAFLHDGLAMCDLNDRLASASSGWVLVVAHDINNQGQIAGAGWNPNGQKHAFLATPQ